MSILNTIKSDLLPMYSSAATAPLVQTALELVIAPLHMFLPKPQPIFSHPEYIEFTRRINPLKRAAMESRLSRISEHSLSQLLAAIQRYDWFNDPIFNQPDWTDIVMEALRRGLIDRPAASSLLLFWERKNEEGPGKLQVIALFKQDGTRNPEAFETIFKSLEFSKKNELRSSSHYLTKQQLIQFFDKMKGTHNLQKYFFLSYEKLKPFSGMEFQYNTLDCTPLQYFARTSEGDFGRMTPSPQMMETFLTVHCGAENAVRPNLILGSSEWKEFLDVTKHDVQIPSPDEPIPELVHSFRVIHDDFTDHDYYHLVVKSGIPRRMREIYAQISLSIKNLENNTPDSVLREALHAWRERLLDMDLGSFRQDRRQKTLQNHHLNPDNLSPLFWAGFTAILGQVEMLDGIKISDETLKTIMLQIPVDPILGKTFQYILVFGSEMDRFNTVAQIWKERTGGVHVCK